MMRTPTVVGFEPRRFWTNAGGTAVVLETDPAADMETPIGQRWISIVSEALDGDIEAIRSESRVSFGAVPGRLGTAPPPDRSAVDAIDEYLRLAGTDLRERRRECFTRSRLTFIIMITLAIMSLVVFSVTALVTGLSLSAGTIVPSAISALLASATAPAWKLYQAENARAAQFDRDLVRLEEIRIARVLGVKKVVRGDGNLVFGSLNPRVAKKSHQEIDNTHDYRD